MANADLVLWCSNRGHRRLTCCFSSAGHLLNNFLPTVGGAVLLVEALLSEDGSGPLTAQLYSLNMLVQTEGRERTDVQYAALLTAAGFTSVRHRLTGKIYDAVLGRKETKA